MFFKELLLTLFVFVVQLFVAFLLSPDWITGHKWIVAVAPITAFAIGFFPWWLSPVFDFIDRIKIKQVEGRFPGMRATLLSNGNILLTDKATGATAVELLRRVDV